MPSAPRSSTIRLINAWLSGSMAPEAVQTKHSVRVSITSAPALRATAAIASPGTLSRSPSAITHLPSSCIRRLTSFVPSWSCSRGLPQMFGNRRADRRSPAQQPLDRLFDLIGRRAVTREPLDLDAVAHREVGGQAGDAQVATDLAVVGRVDRDEADAIAVAFGERLHRRHQRETRLALRPPDVD